MAIENLGTVGIWVQHSKVSPTTRPRVGVYLRLSNYVANLRRIGFGEDDVTFPGSDRLIDALAVHGDAGAVAAQLRAHLAAGADQVAIQVLAADGDILPTARALAGQI